MISTSSDFLIEDQCSRGHASSALLRGHTAEIARGLAALLDIAASTCRLCGAHVARRVVELPPHDEVEAFRNAATVPAPAMPPAESLPPGPRSSVPPRDPPLDEHEGPIVAGD